jgi:hypothetical protein
MRVAAGKRNGAFVVGRAVGWSFRVAGRVVGWSFRVPTRG